MCVFTTDNCSAPRWTEALCRTLSTNWFFATIYSWSIVTSHDRKCPNIIPLILSPQYPTSQVSYWAIFSWMTLAVYGSHGWQVVFYHRLFGSTIWYSFFFLFRNYYIFIDSKLFLFQKIVLLLLFWDSPLFFAAITYWRFLLSHVYYKGPLCEALRERDPVT